MRYRFNLIAVVTSFIIAASFTSCGGGGGSGGGGREGSSARTGVRVLHAAIDASPVDVVSNDGTSASTIVTRAKFGSASLYGGTGTGARIVTMTRALTPSVVVGQSNETIGEGERRSFFLYGDNQSFGLRTKILIDNPGDFDSGTGKVRVVDGATGASNITVGLDVGSFGTVPFGEASDYQPVAEGAHRFVFRRQSDGASVGSVNVIVEAGRAYSILVAGEIGYFTTVAVVTDND